MPRAATTAGCNVRNTTNICRGVGESTRDTFREFFGADGVRLSTVDARVLQVRRPASVAASRSNRGPCRVAKVKNLGSIGTVRIRCNADRKARLVPEGQAEPSVRLQLPPLGGGGLACEGLPTAREGANGEGAVSAEQGAVA